jgi:glycyl-tRNA synthetase (class II)
VKLVAEKQLAAPKVIDVTELQVDKSAVGKQFKQDAKVITGYFEKLSTEEIEQVEKKIGATTGYFCCCCCGLIQRFEQAQFLKYINLFIFSIRDEVEFKIEEKTFSIKKTCLTIKRYQKTVYGW